MVEFEINGVKYRAETMDARRQFHVARRIAGAFKPSAEAFEQVKDAEKTEGGARAAAVVAAINSFFDALSNQSDEQLDYIIDACLDTVSRKSGKTWSALRSGGVQMYDLSLYEIGYIVFKVIEANLTGFFASLPEEVRDTLKAVTAEATAETLKGSGD